MTGVDVELKSTLASVVIVLWIACFGAQRR